MSRESRLVKNTAIIAIGNLFTKCVSFFLLPLYTSILSTEEFGTVDLITTYSSLLATILTLQMEQAVFRFLVEARKNKDLQKQYITTAFTTVLVLLAAFVLLGSTILNLVGYEHTVFLMVNTVVVSTSAIILQIPRGFGDNTTFAAGSCISGVLTVLLNVLFIAVLRMGVAGLMLASILASLTSSIFVACKTRIFGYFCWSAMNGECTKNMMKYALPLIPYTMCWWVIGSADRIMIGWFLGVGANGIYAVANKFPSLFKMVSNIFQTAWMESAFENVDDTDRDKYYNKIVNTVVRFFASCNLLIIAALPFVFGFLVDADFVDAYNYLPIMLTAVMFHSVSAIYGALFFAFKKTKEVTATTVLSAIINVVVNLLLMPFVGLWAAAISTLIAYLINVIVRYFKMKEMCGITITPRFLIGETAIYAGVIAAYYIGNMPLQVVCFVAGLAYGMYSNLDFLKEIWAKIRKKEPTEVGD